MFRKWLRFLLSIFNIAIRITKHLHIGDLEERKFFEKKKFLTQQPCLFINVGYLVALLNTKKLKENKHMRAKRAFSTKFRKFLIEIREN